MFSCRYRQKVVYLQQKSDQKLADRIERWSIYQSISLQKSMVFLSVRLETTVGDYKRLAIVITKMARRCEPDNLKSILMKTRLISIYS